MPVHGQHKRQPSREAMFSELEQQKFVRPIQLVTHKRMTEPGGMDSNLVHSSSERSNASERISARMGERLEDSLRSLASLDDPAAHVNNRVGIFTNGLVNQRCLA